MIDFEIMIKDLRRLACIPRLPEKSKRNWKTVPEHFFKGCGGLNFLIWCNFHTKYFHAGLAKVL